MVLNVEGRSIETIPQFVNAFVPISAKDLKTQDVRFTQFANADASIVLTPKASTFSNLLQSSFVAHIDNQRVAYNTVEKSYRGCFENVKS